MGYNLMYEGTDFSGDAEEDLKIYLYPNTNNSESLVKNDIGPAIKSFCEQLLGDIIFKYEIRREYSHPQHPTDIDSETMMANHWNDSTWDKKGDVEGVHQLVYKGPNSDGISDSPPDIGAWASSQSSVVSFNGDTYDSYGIGALGIHEAMHPLINKYNDNVESMIRTSDSTYSHEHDLGQVYGDGSVSPLGLGYVNNREGHAWHGRCSNDNVYAGTFNHDISSCSKDALCYTSRNVC